MDKKKKKKGTLGVGNGAIFFASESDKVSFPSARVPPPSHGCSRPIRPLHRTRCSSTHSRP